MNIAITPVNDAPVNTVPGAQTINANTALVFSDTRRITVNDVDAGANPVRVTLTASQGTLTLAGNTGLTFDSGDGVADAVMTFTGTLANINTALNNLSFQPLANFTGAAALTISTNDLGNTGGGALVDTDTVAITVRAMNSAPVNTVPGTQVIWEDSALVLSGARRITVSDIDAGANPVQVTLTADQGTATLAGTTGLTFSGGDGAADAVMTFTGTLADINTALNNLSFQPLANFNGAAALTISTNDLGSGGSSALVDTDTVAITVLPVNDAPVNVVPGVQTINEDTALVFSGARRITVSDVDAGTNPMRVTLNASQGTLTLAGTTGLTFSSGDGAADAAMTFTGTLADINTALNNLSFQPLANFNGAAALTISTNDLGNGGGGALSDTDTVAITVLPVNDAPVNTVPGAQINLGRCRPGVLGRPTDHGERCRRRHQPGAGDPDRQPGHGNPGRHHRADLQQRGRRRGRGHDLYRDAGRYQYRPEQPEFPAPGQLQRGRGPDHQHQRSGQHRRRRPGGHRHGGHHGSARQRRPGEHGTGGPDHQ